MSTNHARGQQKIPNQYSGTILCHHVLLLLMWVEISKSSSKHHSCAVFFHNKCSKVMQNVSALTFSYTYTHTICIYIYKCLDSREGFFTSTRRQRPAAQPLVSNIWAVSLSASVCFSWSTVATSFQPCSKNSIAAWFYWQHDLQSLNDHEKYTHHPVSVFELHTTSSGSFLAFSIIQLSSKTNWTKWSVPCFPRTLGTVLWWTDPIKHWLIFA